MTESKQEVPSEYTDGEEHNRSFMSVYGKGEWAARPEKGTPAFYKCKHVLFIECG